MGVGRRARCYAVGGRPAGPGNSFSVRGRASFCLGIVLVMEEDRQRRGRGQSNPGGRPASELCHSQHGTGHLKVLGWAKAILFGKRLAWSDFGEMYGVKKNPPKKAMSKYLLCSDTARLLTGNVLFFRGGGIMADPEAWAVESPGSPGRGREGRRVALVGHQGDDG
ncbi:hypothetical protein IF2G_09510 [Cordyceps javanica]|nr:hypothetical protein IF2G_09510 [Cordyceps javanica]